MYVKMMKALKDGEGVTLKNGKEISFKSGWQVADYGVEVSTAEDASKAIETMNGTCGVWLENGVFYVDHSFRVATKAEALKIGREHKQISIFGWAKKVLAYC